MVAVTKREKMAVQICSDLNNFTDLKPTLKSVIKTLKQITDIEAISIRLKDGEDYPYYVYRGFNQSFVIHENSLCVKLQSGDYLLEENSTKVLLGCMCGNIIRGRTDPSFPFFSDKGSFWSNHTSKLLATTTDEDRQSHTRNYCNSCGYESVALIPISRSS